MTPSSDDQIWNEIQSRLRAKTPKTLNSDIFSNKVMARISNLDRPAASMWSKPWWMIPALAFGSWMVLFFGVKMDETPFGTQSLLMAGQFSEQAQLLLQQPTVAADDIFTLLMEDNRP